MAWVETRPNRVNFLYEISQLVVRVDHYAENVLKVQANFDRREALSRQLSEALFSGADTTTILGTLRNSPSLKDFKEHIEIAIESFVVHGDKA